MEQTGLELNLKEWEGHWSRKKGKWSEKAHAQGRRVVVAEAGRRSMDMSCHGSSHHDFSFSNLSQFPAGFFLASLSSLDVMVSPSDQACRLYALATLGLPLLIASSSPTPAQLDTPGASQRLASWVPDAWQSFPSFPIYQLPWPVQTMLNLKFQVISLPLSHFLPISSQKVEALLHGLQHTLSPLENVSLLPLILLPCSRPPPHLHTSHPQVRL